jgi:hypothetical protein
MKGVHRLYQLQVVVGDDELLQQSLESGQLSHPGMKLNCVKKLVFFFMYSHSKASHKFLSKVQNPSFKIKGQE